MNWDDATLVRLADPATRRTLFDDDGLESVLRAAYDLDAIGVDAPFDPVFDQLTVGVRAPTGLLVEGAWMGAGGAERRDARFQLAGPAAPGATIVDAVWQGAVVGHLVPTTDRIDEVKSAWVTPAPSAHAAVEATGELQVHFTAPPAAPPPAVARRLPILAAVLVRDAAVSVRALLADTFAALTTLEALGEDLPRGDVRPKRTRIGIWILPSSTFNDDGWPGAAGADAAARRAARLAAARAWLADQGIAVIVPPEP